MARQKEVHPYQSYTAEATVNISDIIPRGKTQRCKDTTLDMAILADYPVITEIIVEETQCPTLYIAGDSTVTDQGCAYPYDPGSSYSGWGQMLSNYVKPGIAVSNHSHSGLTTESFRSEGHYSIIEEQIKPGDYFLMQFAHNDQKLPQLTARGGYQENLIRYISEIRAKSAFPVIVTPIARNTWKSDGSYNDLLEEFANVCKEIGQKLNVPVIDLHGKSMDFVIREGLEEAARYYFPKDYTHSNDYGAYLMARYIAEGCSKLPALHNYIFRLAKPSDGVKTDNPAKISDDTDWVPPENITVPVPPLEFRADITNEFKMNFKDIEKAHYQNEIISLTEAGIIQNQEEYFRGLDPVTRIEALDWIVKAVRFVPMNVYNDRYPDVIGHEWYAGVVETVIQNGMVRDMLTADGKFHPEQKVTALEMTSFCMVSYRCRKLVKDKLNDVSIPGVGSWAKDDINTALHLGFIPGEFDPQKELSREEAAVYVKKLLDLLT
jgi:lysophospholipase L1-like esterase